MAYESIILYNLDNNLSCLLSTTYYHKSCNRISYGISLIIVSFIPDALLTIVLHEQYGHHRVILISKVYL